MWRIARIEWYNALWSWSVLWIQLLGVQILHDKWGIVQILHDKWGIALDSLSVHVTKKAFSRNPLANTARDEWKYNGNINPKTDVECVRSC